MRSQVDDATNAGGPSGSDLAVGAANCPNCGHLVAYEAWIPCCDDQDFIGCPRCRQGFPVDAIYPECTLEQREVGLDIDLSV